MDDKKLFRECMAIVNQLYDLTDASVESRQIANDDAYYYLFTQIKRMLVDNKLSEFNINADSNCKLCGGSGEYHTGGSFGGSVEIHRCPCTKFYAVKL